MEQRWFAYGNYVDEVLMMGTSTTEGPLVYYGHDHLYSQVLLAWYRGNPAAQEHLRRNHSVSDMISATLQTYKNARQWYRTASQ